MIAMNIQNKNQFLSIEQLQDQYLNKSHTTVQTQTADGLTFQEILSQKTEKLSDNETLKFSKHAMNRLSDRNITLTDEQLERLNDGTRKASEKGIKESLVLIDELAFIVNVNHNTVITAMDQAETKENIFTNIDGAVIN